MYLFTIVPQPSDKCLQSTVSTAFLSYIVTKGSWKGHRIHIQVLRFLTIGYAGLLVSELISVFLPQRFCGRKVQTCRHLPKSQCSIPWVVFNFSIRTSMNLNRLYSKQALYCMRITVENIRFWGSVCLGGNKITGRIWKLHNSMAPPVSKFLLHLSHIRFLLLRYIQFSWMWRWTVYQSLSEGVYYTVCRCGIYCTVTLLYHICHYFRLDGLVDLLNE